MPFIRLSCIRPAPAHALGFLEALGGGAGPLRCRIAGAGILTIVGYTDRASPLARRSASW